MRYAFRKLVTLLLSLFLIASATFFLMKAAPGDPFSEEQSLPKEVMEQLNEYYGLKDPWYLQYVRYLKHAALLDLGPSFKFKSRTVNEIITEGFPISACLGAEALFLAISLGTILGTIAALKENKWQDYGAMLLAVAGISIPSFLFATAFQYLLGLQLGLFPVARWGSFSHTILPSLSLSLMPMAFIARLVRTNMIDVLQQDYIKTALAKGLPYRKVIIVHALRNAILPVVSYLGPFIANIFVGSFVIEKIFAIPGLGQWLILAISNRDYPMIMGMTLFASALLLAATLLTDLLYVWINPRIRLEGGGSH